MSKPLSEKERDINLEEGAEATTEGVAEEPATDNVSEEQEGANDNVSVEPSLEEQIGVWRDK